MVSDSEQKKNNVGLVCLPVNSTKDQKNLASGSIKAACSKCGCPVWLSKSGQQAVNNKEKFTSVSLFCTDCAFADKKFVEGMVANPEVFVPGSIQELKEEGVSSDAILNLALMLKDPKGLEVIKDALTTAK